MQRQYTSDEEVAALVRSFENATISRDEWKHPEHLVVALHYLTRHDLDTAIDKMRSGIHNLLVNGYGVNLKVEMPYHETITVFWMRTISAFIASAGEPQSIPGRIAKMIARFDKDYPLLFYTRELLFSDEARARFVEPDIRQLFD